jgi:chromosome segregation ATPase
LRDTSDGQHDYLAVYDIAFARLEKSLLESNKVIKALEHKLESLQTIKYNLNVDMRKREEELKVKDAKLKASGQEAKLRAQSAIAREQSSVEAIANFMDTAPLTAEYADFEDVQSEKLATLQELVNESELYVNVLERDLDKERLEHEQLLARLENDHSQPLALSPHEEDELRNLREVNSELESEKISLLEQLSNTTEDSEAVEELQRKIKELDMKIETVQVNYVNMEERYLNSLMS